MRGPRVWGVLAGVLATLLIVAAAAEAAPAKAAKCTVKGTKSNDRLHGTPGVDVICGRGGNDRIRSRSGNDVVRGGPGTDTVEAGPGDDTIDGGDGGDLLSGQDDGDAITGGPGIDEIIGGAGRDNCSFEPEDRLDTSCLTDFSIQDVQISPSVVDTSLADAEVTVTAHIVTAPSRFPGGTSSLLDVRVAAQPSAAPYLSPFMSFNTGDPPGQPLQLVSGDANDGVWSGSLTLPHHSSQGEHLLSLLLHSHLTGPPLFGPAYFDNYDPIPYVGLQRAWLDHSLTQVGAGDSGGPLVDSFEITPRHFDTSGGPAELTVEAHVTDDLLGAQDVNVDLEDPNGNRRSTGLQLASGTASDGLWRGKVVMPQWTRAGQHEVSFSTNDGLYRRWISSDDLRALGLDPIVEQIGEDDHEAPELTSLVLHPTSGGVTIDAGVAEAKSGNALLSLTATAPSGNNWYGDFSSIHSDPVSGTRTNGVWSEHFDLAPGTYQLTVVTLEDQQHNNRLYRRADLESAGYTTQFTVP